MTSCTVLLTPTLDWRLGGLDYLCEHASVEFSPLRECGHLIPQQYKSPEVGKSDWSAVKDSPAWALDSWGLGCLVQEVYSGSPLRSLEQLRNTDPVPPSLLPFY